MGAIDDILIGLGTNDCKVEFGQDGEEIGANLERPAGRHKQIF